MRFLNIICGFLATVFIISCNQDKLEPIERSGAKPGSVSDIHVVSQAGTVVLTYSLPSDKDVLYVLAEYTDKYGRIIQTKSSLYTNSLKIEGFADTSIYTLKLYTVTRSEVKSDPVMINVKAGLPPVYKMQQSLKLASDFGGINVQFENATEASVAVVVCYKDSLGLFKNNETYYTKSKNVMFSSRGFPSKETQFGVYLRDRWDNRTDTVFTTLTPIFEKQLDKSKFRAVSLPTDVPVGWGLAIPGMWDNIVNSWGNMWHSADQIMPMHVTFDLGVLAQLSRFNLQQRQGDIYIYNHGNPRYYEIWGSSNPPANGSWDNWTKLVECESIKPSGFPTGTNTTEDVSAAARGEEFNIPLDAPKVRYIRIKILQSWSGLGGLASHIGEVTFYGNDN